LLWRSKYSRKKENEKILSALNEAYPETESSEEIRLREKSKRYYAKKILKEEFPVFDRHIKK